MKKIKKKTNKSKPTKSNRTKSNRTKSKSNKSKRTKSKSTKSKRTKSKRTKIKSTKSNQTKSKSTKSKQTKSKFTKSKPTKKNFKYIEKKKESLISKIVRLQHSLKPEFKIKINFSLEKYIQAFFDKIARTILEYRILKIDEKRKRQLEKIEKIEKEKVLIQKQKIEEEELITKIKEKNLIEEIKLDKQRSKDLKLFLRKEQAIIRIEQAERQKHFLRQLQLEKQIERFRIREVKELEKVEKISLNEKRDDYSGLQERIEKLKEKYRIIRDQKIRERVEALGIEIDGDEDRETLFKKEKDYTIARQKIELSLESFYRSASSLVFQLNKRHVTRHMSIFRCIDRRFETGEIFIKWDEAPDEEWLILIYIKNNSPINGIVIEDKTNQEKNFSHDFKTNEIFKASDLMVDSLTQLIASKRTKKD
jgi:hypothetical protein